MTSGCMKYRPHEIQWLTQNSGDDTSPSWSWDGKRICWLHAEGAANCIYVYEDGLPVKQVRVEIGIHHLPQFTPDGEIIFLFESPKQPPDLWKLNLDGTFEQLTNSMPGEYREAEFVMPEEISYENEGDKHSCFALPR